MINKEIIVSKYFIISLILLLFNDFYLKDVFHNFLTGKLSDLSGLFIFPLFWYSIFKKKKLLIYWLTAVMFILWKSPIATNLILGWNDLNIYQISRIVDYSDFFALAVLPISYFYRPKSINYSFRISIRPEVTIFVLTAFSFLATAGIHGNFGEFNFNASKKEVNRAIKNVLITHPRLIIPDTLQMYTAEYKNANQLAKNRLSEISADSVSFHMLYDNRILWFKFSGAQDDWEEKGCTLGLISISDKNDVSIKHNGSEIPKAERILIREFFQKVMVRKIDSIINNDVIQ